MTDTTTTPLHSEPAEEDLASRDAGLEAYDRLSRAYVEALLTIENLEGDYRES